MKRGGRIRYKATGAIARIEEALDKLFSKLILKRDKHLCQRCRVARATDAHHIFTRVFKSVRWNLRNGVGLCRTCHDWAGAHQVAYASEIVYGPFPMMTATQYEELRLEANTPIASPSLFWYEEVKRVLEQHQ